MKTYPVNEVFCSLQGEGAMCGTLTVFVRFAGCNQTCRVETHGFDCDTEFRSAVSLTAQQIVERAQAAWTGKGRMRVTLTGGEPLLHVDHDLAVAIDQASSFVAVETNGSLPLSDEVCARIKHVCCSPKVAEHAIRLREGQVDEWRYVRHAGQGAPRPPFAAPWQFVSPAWEALQVDRDALRTCVDIVRADESWRLSMQTHKLLGIR